MINGTPKGPLSEQVTERMIERIEDLGRISLMVNSMIDEMNNYVCDNKQLFMKVFEKPEDVAELFDFFNDLYRALHEVLAVTDGEG